MTIEPTNVSEGAEPCSKCGGSGTYSYDRNHSKICEACCSHDEGWWLLRTHYGDHNGKYACKRGCGETRWPEELGVEVPQTISAATLSPPLPSPGVERLRERVAAFSNDSGGNMPADNSIEISVPLGELRAALSALPLDGGLK